MRAFLVFTLSICVEICCGRYFNRRVFEYKPGIAVRGFALSDEVCEDNPNYADACPEKAAVENYCKDQEKFMKENCPKSCGFCVKEPVKPPAPAAVCEDDSRYADACPAYAAMENYCKDQEKFMMKNCPKSCGFCSEEPVKPPAPATVCEDDPSYADACPEKAAIKDYCKDQKDFMTKNCPKSCGFCSEGTVTPTVSTEPVKPPAPVVCEDDPNYADACPEKAEIKNYCKDQEEFMRKNCPKSCGFCSKATVQPAVSTACKDDPEYVESCKDIAANTSLCEEQKDFTQKHCALSCKWCESPTNKAPIQAITVCEEDLPKWAARCPEWASKGKCDDPKKQVFLFHYCRKSCKLPCKTEPPPISSTKPPSPPAFCRDRDINCGKWKSLGFCGNPKMPIYCGVTCGICQEPTPDECFDKTDNCEDLKKAGFCTSTVPTNEYEVKTNCLETCEFCVPGEP